MNATDAARSFKDHGLVADFSRPGVRFERRPAKTPDGTVADGLFNVWITLDNPAQFNSYTTDMVKGAILALLGSIERACGLADRIAEERESVDRDIALLVG